MAALFSSVDMLSGFTTQLVLRFLSACCADAFHGSIDFRWSAPPFFPLWPLLAPFILHRLPGLTVRWFALVLWSVVIG